MPDGFASLASTDSALAAMGNDVPHLRLAVSPRSQPHTAGQSDSSKLPEHRGLPLDWTSENFIEAALREIREQVGEHDVACALSGGVDSTVAAALMHRAIGD